MRRALLSLAVLLLSAPVRATEGPAAPEATLTVDAGGLVFSNRLGVEFEQSISRIFSVYVEPKLVFGHLHAAPNTTPDGVYGGELALGLRWFINQGAPRGLYLGPQLDVAWGHGNVRGQDTGTYRIAGGALLGYTLLIAQRVDLSIGAGALYRYDHSDVGSTPSSTQGIVPTVRLAAGIAF